MNNINENILNLNSNYLFSRIKKKVKEFEIKNPNSRILNLGIGDVTKPIPKNIVESMKNACDEMQNSKTFKGYGPENGYEFLREKISLHDYKKNGINIDKNEIFISDGSKSDISNISDLFSKDNIIAIPDPVYPVYLDTNVIDGRSGIYIEQFNIYKNIIYLPCNAENNFIPSIPQKTPDIIYLCYPNNPTGTVLTKEQLKMWVEYAKEKHCIILFDSAYEKYITEENIPHSIYEIEDAKNVAIELRSFSKTAGFTGIRCSYIVIPKELKGYTKLGKKIKINELWNKRIACKFNGVSYITQRGAEAVYEEDSQKEIMSNINYYLNNAKIIKEVLKKKGYEVFGGDNSPYIWFKVPENMNSWQFFDKLLSEKQIVGTPGSGFGTNGEGYFRITGFGEKQDIIEAVKRI